jgi:hypothetical protein
MIQKNTNDECIYIFDSSALLNFDEYSQKAKNYNLLDIRTHEQILMTPIDTNSC